MAASRVMIPITESATPTEIPAIAPFPRELPGFFELLMGTLEVVDVWVVVRDCEKVDWRVEVDYVDAMT
jgi:hypothetical protein